VSAVRQAEAKRRARVAPMATNGAVGSYAITDDGTRIYFERFSPGEGSVQRGGRQPGDAPPALLVMGLGANGRLLGPRRQTDAGLRL
jgi:hypothetical protein